jgi:hypothetical protein
VHGVIDDNINHCKSMIMDAMRMNQSDSDQCSIIDEEPNIDTTSFFDLLKDCDEP